MRTLREASFAPDEDYVKLSVVLYAGELKDSFLKTDFLFRHFMLLMDAFIAIVKMHRSFLVSIKKHKINQILSIRIKFYTCSKRLDI